MQNFKGLENFIVKFFYLREQCNRKGHRGKPVVSVCLLTKPNVELVARGISICSLQDMNSKAYNKNTGRSLALKRACSAWFRTSYDKSIRREEAIKSLCLIDEEEWFTVFQDYPEDVLKAEVIPVKELSALERAIISK